MERLQKVIQEQRVVIDTLEEKISKSNDDCSFSINNADKYMEDQLNLVSFNLEDLSNKVCLSAKHVFDTLFLST